jgi:hypothetical protein
MDSEVQKSNQTKMRDYDKEPIVIEDYNYIFLFLDAVYTIPILLLIYIYNPGNVSEESLFRHVFIIIPIMMIPAMVGYKKAKGKRFIRFEDNQISYQNEEKEIEKIHINELTELKKSYTDFYHKSQELSLLGKLIAFIGFPFAILLHVELLINKLMFHILKDGYKSYRFYDAIVIFTGNRFINILPTTIKEYNDVKKYFIEQLNVNIEHAPVYFKYAYGYENLNKEGK